MISHVRPQRSMLKREQNYVARSLPKKPCGPRHIVCHPCGTFGHLRSHYCKFQALKKKKKNTKKKTQKKKRNLSFLEVVLCKLNQIWLKVVSCWNMWLMLLSPCLCASPVLNLLTPVSLFMRHSFQTIVLFGWGRVPMVELMLF